MIPEIGDILTLGLELPKEEQDEVTIVAIDTERGLFTVYSPADDECYVLVLSKGRFKRLIFERKKEPWEN